MLNNMPGDMSACRDLYGFKRQLDGSRFALCYSGALSQGTIEAIGETLKSRMLDLAADANVRQKVFAVFVEQAQNVMHYSAEIAHEDAAQNKAGRGIIVIGQEGGTFFVESGNLVEKLQTANLVERLERIRKMSADGLKSYYRDQLKKYPDGESKGAGVGFVDMARKASRPIEYHIEPVDDNYAFFAMKVCV